MKQKLNHEQSLDIPDSRPGIVLAGGGGDHCLGGVLPGHDEEEER